MKRVVANLRDVRPIWGLTENAVETIRGAFPPDWEVRFVETGTSGSGDGRWDVPVSVLEEVSGAEVYLGFGIPSAVLRAGSRLRWVHSAAAGVRGSLTPELRARDVVFTSSAGVHAVPMAEWVIASILHFARGLDLAERGRAAGEWDSGPFLSGDTPVREVGGTTVGLFGFGGIGREVAPRAQALGMDVLALRRSSVEPPGPGRARRPGPEILYGRDGLDELLERSDHLVLCAPETPETTGIIDARGLDRMKPGAVLLNLSRGGLVDEPALVEALRSGRLRGAALDVYATEPLPAGHPLWTLPNVLLTPHVSAVSRRFWERESALIAENARRFLAGGELLNTVDAERGY